MDTRSSRFHVSKLIFQQAGSIHESNTIDSGALLAPHWIVPFCMSMVRVMASGEGPVGHRRRNFLSRSCSSFLRDNRLSTIDSNFFVSFRWFQQNSRFFKINPTVFIIRESKTLSCKAQRYKHVSRAQQSATARMFCLRFDDNKQDSVSKRSKEMIQQKPSQVGTRIVKRRKCAEILSK